MEWELQMRLDFSLYKVMNSLQSETQEGCGEAKHGIIRTHIYNLVWYRDFPSIPPSLKQAL